MILKNEYEKKIEDIRHLLNEVNRANREIVERIRDLIDHKAHEYYKCKKTKLIKLIDIPDETSRSQLYRLFNLAIVESEIGVPSNTLYESWVRAMTSSLKKANLAPDIHPNCYRKIWKYALNKAGDKSKIKMPLIREAINYVIASTLPETEQEQAEEKRAEVRIQPQTKNTELITQLFKDIKSSHSKSLEPILNILKSKPEKLHFYRVLTTLNDEERNDLMALIHSDDQFFVL